MMRWALLGLGVAGAATATSAFRASAQLQPEPAFALGEHLGTKSPYPIPARNSTADSGCDVDGLYLVSRHGTRNPTNKDVVKFGKLGADLRSSLNGTRTAFAGYVASWQNPWKESRASFLSEAGERDLFGLGQRFRRDYARFLDSKVGAYDPLR
jgi:hypothetical protein